MKCQFCPSVICNYNQNRINPFKYSCGLFESKTSVDRFLMYLKCIFDYKSVPPFYNSQNHCYTTQNCSGFVNESIKNFTEKDWEFFLFKKNANWSILSIEAIRYTYTVTPIFRPIFDIFNLPFVILFIRRQTNYIPKKYNHVMFHICNGKVLGMNHPGSPHMRVQNGIFNIDQLYRQYKDGIRPVGHTGDDVFQMEYINVKDVFRSLGVKI